MSVIVGFKQVSPAILEEIVRDPQLINAVLFPVEEAESEEIDRGIDLDKAWHGIHFLLTGRKEGGDPPLAYAIMGGHEIGPDLGMGPARYLTAEEVKAVAKALSEITKEELRRRFDPKALKKAKIYPPELWDEPNEAREFLVGNFEFMKNYYNDSATKGNAILIYTA